MIKDITLGYQFLPLNWKEEILPRMGEGAQMGNSPFTEHEV